MATGELGRVIQALRKAARPGDEAEPSDGQLLECYVRRREEAAFAALVRRHGPMVWGVCRRVLACHQDAEDAFQATFLVLLRKAASIVPRDMLANWLYGVAHQTALKARATTARRRAREKQVTAMPEPAAQPQALWDDVQPRLDQELSRLPDKYRAIIILCDLTGKTRKEAARQLKLPEGTVASRLATARTLLARRLTRSGLAVPSAALAAVLAQQAASARVPAAVACGTVRAALTGTMPPRAVALAGRVLKAMLLRKLRIATAVLLIIALAAGGAMAAAQRPPLEAPAHQPQAEPNEPVKDDHAGDWPQWRGPNRDGVVHGVPVPNKWPRTLQEDWNVPVGKGVASPVVVGSNIYLLTRQKDDAEIVSCHELQTGKEVWRSQPCPAPYKVGPGEGNADDRPRSTPAVADGRVFTLGMTGQLSCLDAATGQLLWRKDTKYTHYMGTSPLLVNGLCVAQVGDGGKIGGLTAFDVKTGDVRWCFTEAGSYSGSPILVDLAGERQLVTYSNWNAAGVSLATGKKLWGVGPGGAGMPCTTPLLSKDLIILADNMDSLRALRLERGERGIIAKEVWKSNADLKLYYCSPVVAADLVFGMSTKNGGCFFCLDARSGRTRWESPGRQGGYASLLSLGSVLLFLKDRGQLLVVKASGAAFEVIAEYRVSDRATTAHPVFLGDRVVIKDDITLRCFRIGQDAAR
jgi:RNA polymerase sigma factor (sigma-70 family)